MKASRIVFPQRDRVEIEEFDLDNSLKPHEVLVESIYTLICPGTELAKLRGNNVLPPYTVKYPVYAHYTGVGSIVRKGSKVKRFEEGDIVFAYSSPHASYYKADLRERLLVKIPTNLRLEFIPFARFATIALTALRVSDGELGDYVVVQGLGMVGNLAAQLFQIGGMEVIGMEISRGRVKKAKDSGIKIVINPMETNVEETIKDITGGEGCMVGVEATGNPELIKQICKLVGTGGEVILLGSPRGECKEDITPILNYIHLWPKSITLKGAHEWRRPLFKTPYSKHSIERDVEIVFRLIEREKLVIEPLLTHIVEFDRAEEGYMGLLNDRDRYLGVLISWQS